MNPPKMPIHIGDYKRDTSHLRAAGHGAYLLLLFHHWSTGALPNDDDQLAAIACMTRAEWRRAKPIIEKFFGPGWRHGRVEKDLEEARASYEKRAKAGEKGGKAKAESKQCSSNATAGPEQPLTLDLRPEKKKDSDPTGSDATASRDVRAELFGKGLKTLAEITGKTPDSSRSLVGRWLKSVNDEAIHVLGAIDEAARNRVADPVAWITKCLQPHTGDRHGKRTVQDAARDLVDLVADKFGDVPTADGGRGRAPPVRLLPTG